MNQSKVPHDEVGLRLTICSEFLIDEQKPIEKAYEGWMKRVGGSIIDLPEFEYWYKRFQNNQFDLGYDTNLDSKKNEEIINEAEIVPVVAVEKKEQNNAEIEPEVIKTEDIPVVVVENNESILENIPNQIMDKKPDHRFDVQNVVQFFRELVEEQNIGEIRCIKLLMQNSGYVLCSGYESFFFEKGTDGWTVKHGNHSERIEAIDPEESVVNHLWYLLKNPNLELTDLVIGGNYSTISTVDHKKLNPLLQSLFNSFDHQINAVEFRTEHFSEDTFCSMLKALKPKTLEKIDLKIEWKEGGNYQKMKEIVKMDQWKKAKSIESNEATSLTLGDVLHFTYIQLTLDRITPEDVARFKKHFLKSPDNYYWSFVTKQRFDIDEMKKALRLRGAVNQIRYYRHIPNEEQYRLEISVEQGRVIFQKAIWRDRY